MKYLLVMAILFWLPHSTIYAQISFEKGYYIDNSGKRVDGLIKNLDWKNNPSEFDFKTSSNDSPTTFSLKYVQEFGFPGIAKYVRAKVKIDKSSSLLNAMSENRNPEFVEEQIFLKYLVEGKAGLFRYLRGNLSRYFYQIDLDSIKPLIYKTYMVKDNSRIAKNERYKQQLLNNLKCTSITERDIKKLGYKNHDLKRIFIKYNKCQKADFTQYEKKEKRNLFNLNIRLGPNYTNLNIQHFSDYGKITETKLDAKTNLKVGLEAEYILPFNKNKWAMIVEPTYQYYNSEKIIDKKNAKVDYKSIEFPIGLRYYMFLNGNSKFFINASYVFDFALKSTIDFEYGSDLEIDPRSNLALGFGYKFMDRYSVELRYGFNREVLSNYSNYTSDYKSLSFLVGYTLL